MTRELFGGVTEQAKASLRRWEDANSLLAAQRWRGAMYLAGYSVECLMKARLLEKFDCDNLQQLERLLQEKGLLSVQASIYTHQLEVLLRLTGGLDRLRGDKDLWPMFVIVNRWVPAWRYHPRLGRSDEAEDYLDAAAKLRQWIQNNV